LRKVLGGVRTSIVALALWTSACAPQAVDRARVEQGLDGGGGDSAVTPAYDASRDGAAGSDGAPADRGDQADRGGAAPADAPVKPVQADAAPTPDLTPDTHPEDTVGALLALTPQSCAMKLTRDFDLAAGGGNADAGTTGTAAICGLQGAVYWVADMNITCDGRPTPGKCLVDHDADTFAHARGNALAAAVTPYVVVPANLSIAGLRAGSVVAVINTANKQMTYAVVGDTSTNNTIGGCSWACAEKVGIDPDPVLGGQKGNTVVYIAFTSSNAVPTDIESLPQTAALGATLTSKLLMDNK
jgi:hypothetical protein